mgnify:CR=1 FL=1
MKTCTTKQDFQQLLSNLLAPLKPFYLESGAGLDIGHTGSCYPQRTILMEAFSRPLWGLVPFWAGGGAEDDFAALYAAALSTAQTPTTPTIGVGSAAVTRNMWRWQRCLTRCCSPRTKSGR